MAWTDQCKIAFGTNAKALQLTQVGKKNISKILKQLAEESGIPWKTLYRWWNEQENLKNENIEEAVENTSEKEDNQSLLDEIKASRPHRATGEPMGGKREGAGRPAKVCMPSQKKEPVEFTDAMLIATFIICHLERIRNDDPKRNEAFDKIIEWITINRR